MVRVDVLPGVGAVGEKEAVAPAGRPAETESVTGLVKLPTAFTLTVYATEAEPQEVWVLLAVVSVKPLVAVVIVKLLLEISKKILLLQRTMIRQVVEGVLGTLIVYEPVFGTFEATTV